jgi:hypothetical protein
MAVELEKAVQILLNAASSKEEFTAAVLELESLSEPEFLLVLLKALSMESQAKLVRLRLARLLMELGCNPFALEQLIILKSQSDSRSLEALIEKIAAQSGPKDGGNMQTEGMSSQTLASLDFDIDVIDEDKH